MKASLYNGLVVLVLTCLLWMMYTHGRIGEPVLAAQLLALYMLLWKHPEVRKRLLNLSTGASKKTREQVQWLHKAAQQGDAKAQICLGRAYARGEGVTQDYSTARKWYRQAARQGLTLAHCAIATMYYKGQGAPIDYAKAAKWFRQAAELGDADARGILGSMYHIGMGVPKSDWEAYIWFSLAVVSGDAEQAGNRENAAKALTPGQMREARAEIERRTMQFQKSREPPV